CDNTLYNEGNGGGIGAGIALYGSAATVQNTLIVNSGSGIVDNGVNNAFSNNVCDTTNSRCQFSSTASAEFTTPGSDFHLKAGATSIGAGANLSSIFTTDKAGNPRPPPPAAWDIGAYEYVSGGGSRCDLNGDGAVNAADLQLLVNAILSASTDTKYDLNR